MEHILQFQDHIQLHKYHIDLVSIKDYYFSLFLKIDVYFKHTLTAPELASM
jgi:hypothetical protein